MTKTPTPTATATWVDQYFPYLTNTGGNDVRELLSRDVNPRTNEVVAVLQISVSAQINLLTRLRDAGLLKTPGKAKSRKRSTVS